MSQLTGAPSRYLDGRVSTASQPELQLMLLDGALRFGRQAQDVWQDANQAGERDRLLGRILDIIEELVRAAAAGKTEQSKRLEEEYAFAYREIVLAGLNNSAEKFAAAINLLAFERETWNQACLKLRSDAALATPPPLVPQSHVQPAAQGFSLHA